MVHTHLREAGHALGTLAIVLIVIAYVYRPLLKEWSRNRFSVSLAVFSLGIMLGVIWEFVEWSSVYYIFAENPDGIRHDVLSDLVFDSMGAAASMPIGYWAYAHDRDSMAGRFFDDRRP